ncbi:hypothetical protein PENTCL1PPCAC_20902 [Pristionchus entomophagus]|uniref:Uncharacterized protein n=1 Tax=Pristionchus entomophagus TaxID=358040 RepID=A0AAV5TWI5_9BILA|nr:hypothetical protein PENTCL1PPCAC_20902 [Pristionchus entomophagus]
MCVSCSKLKSYPQDKLELLVNSKEATCATKQLTILLTIDSFDKCIRVESLFCTPGKEWDTTGGNFDAYSSLAEAVKDPKFDSFYVRCLDPGQECEWIPSNAIIKSGLADYVLRYVYVFK